MTLSLAGRYSEKVLLISGLSADGRAELYKFVDFAAGLVHETRVPVDELRDRQLDVIKDGLAGTELPYGHTAPEQLLGYFMHPHEFVQTTAGDIVVSFKQAPYVRVLGSREERLWPAPEKLDYGRMLSSTNCETAPGVVGLTAVASADRFARYRGGADLIGCELLTYEPATGVERRVDAVRPFIRDTLHQLQYSPAGYHVGVDMGLEADVAAAGFRDAPGTPFDVDAYARAPFPRSGFFVRDERTGTTTTHVPQTSCAAHAEIDPVDPAVFYVSCHNISKWRNNVVVHGPGALEKYRWSPRGVTRLGRFTDPGFLRVTSQALFERDGETFIAVPAFPNAFYLLDSDLNVVRRTVLFEDEVPEPPFVCAKNTPAPLYLAVAEDTRHAFLTGASELFVVDLDDCTLVDRVRFCEPGSFLATAHVDLVARSAAVRRLVQGAADERAA
ncbi:hypothetical protein [Streptomyces cinereospinus]|uniref:Uncharacterized protein n=1 Tax=Streptomyces cinereospinus TaxID=285561 RepID=A0ABV5N741_9ACTN